MTVSCTALAAAASFCLIASLMASMSEDVGLPASLRKKSHPVASTATVSNTVMTGRIFLMGLFYKSDDLTLYDLVALLAEYGNHATVPCWDDLFHPIICLDETHTLAGLHFGTCHRGL